MSPTGSAANASAPRIVPPESASQLARVSSISDAAMAKLPRTSSVNACGPKGTAVLMLLIGAASDDLAGPARHRRLRARLRRRAARRRGAGRRLVLAAEHLPVDRRGHRLLAGLAHLADRVAAERLHRRRRLVEPGRRAVHRL